MPDKTDTYTTETVSAASLPWTPLDAGNAGISPIKSLARVARRYQKWILICWVAAILFSLPLAILTPNKYTASALVTFDGALPELSSGVQETVRSFYMSEFYAKNQMALLASYDLADQILSDPANTDIRASLSKRTDAADADAATMLGYKNPLPLLNRYINNIDSLRIPTTLTTKVWASSADPLLAARIVNTHAEQFIELVKRREKAALEGVAAHLEQQVSEISSMLEANAGALEEEITASPDPEVFVQALLPGVPRTENALGYLLQQYAHQLGDLSQLQGAAGNPEGLAWTRLVDDPSTYDQLRSLVQLKGEYEGLEKSLTPRHPQLLSLGAKIEALTKALSQQRRAKFDAVRTEEVVQRSSAADLWSMIGDNRAKISKGIISQLHAASPIDDFVGSHERHKLVLETAAAYRMLAQRDLLRIDLVRAIPPSSPTGMPGTIFLLIGCFLGPVFGGIVALTLHTLDQSIRSSDDLAASGLTFLGAIPEASGDDALGPSAPKPGMSEGIQNSSRLKRVTRTMFGSGHQRTSTTTRVLTVVDPTSSFTEAIRGVRTAVSLRTNRSKAKVLLVTSPGAQEGKTTIAVNLASSLAQTGFKTLLIDCDLRHPRIHVALALDNNGSFGMSDVLAGRVSHDKIVLRTAIDSLQAIVAGAPTLAPVELLSQRKFLDVLELAGDNYDYVVIDSPPLMHFADARVIGCLVDQVLLVCRHCVTPRPALRRSRIMLEELGISIIGCVVNAVDPEDGEDLLDEYISSHTDKLSWLEKLRGGRL